MFVIIGLVIVFGAVIGGYVMHHGELMVLVQLNEFLILGGAAVGTLIIANPPSVLKACLAQTLGLLKPNPYGAKAYAELLQVLYEIFQKARKDGLVGLESHIEDPDSSDIFQKYPSFMGNHHAVALLCDTLKVLLTEPCRVGELPVPPGHGTHRPTTVTGELDARPAALGKQQRLLN